MGNCVCAYICVTKVGKDQQILRIQILLPEIRIVSAFVHCSDIPLVGLSPLVML